MNETSNAIINNIIHQYTKPIEEVLHGWIILIDGQVWKPHVGSFLFNSRKQAVTAFYNGMRWRVVSIMGRAEGNNHYWRDCSMYWTRFKEALKDRMEIRQI